MKRFIPVLSALAILLLSFPVFASNPFVDVPLNHWAYDAVKRLSASGIIVGYPDGTFQGTKPITRYEMAMVIARALANVDETKASKEDLALLKKLVLEFQDELKALGVKLDKIDKRLASVEKNLNNFAFSGEFFLDFLWNEENYDEEYKNYQDAFVSRVRLWAEKQVQESVRVVFRFDGGRELNGDGVLSSSGVWAEIDLPWNVSMKIGKFEEDWEGSVGLYYDNEAIISDRTWSPAVMFKRNFPWGNAIVYYAYDDLNETSEYGGRLDIYFKFIYEIRIGLVFIGWETNSALVRNPYLWGADFTVNLAKGIKLYGQYYNEELGGYFKIFYGEQNDSFVCKVGLAVDQSVLKFTSLVFEFFHADQGAFANKYIYGGRAGYIGGSNGIGVFKHDFFPYRYKDDRIGDVVWNRFLPDDVDIVFVKLEQKWSDKVTTIERYYSFDYDTFPDAFAYSIALRYHYTPYTCFELVYSWVDWNRPSIEGENHFLFRTYINF